MAGRVWTMGLLVLLLLFSVWAGSAQAGVEPCPWSVPLASGFDNPLFWVLFNPQPEPPGDWIQMAVDPSVPTAPVFKVNNSSGGKFHLEFAIQNLSHPISGFRFVPRTTGFEVSTLGSAGPLYTASLSFTSGAALKSARASLSPGSDVMFNPQPEPPGYPGVIVDFNLVVGTTGAPPPDGVEIAMTLQLYGPDSQLISLTPASMPFTRGDANADGATDISDAVAILGDLFLGEDRVPCEQAGDANDDGALDISDGIYILSFLFLGGPAIKPPVGACDMDPTGHDLPCSSFPACR